jgi:hypothetical protein
MMESDRCRFKAKAPPIASTRAFLKSCWNAGLADLLRAPPEHSQRHRGEDVARLLLAAEDASGVFHGAHSSRDEG